jgi:uncharacterized protein (DUF433 family)
MTKSQTGELLARITTNPEIYGGKPIIRGKRLSVEHVLADLAAGETPESILANFPFLDADDIRACLLFASHEVGRSGVRQHQAQGTNATAD